jgi:hypothetical protein
MGNLINVYKSEITICIQSLYQHAATGASHDCDERHLRPSCYADTREEVFQRIEESKKPIVLVHAGSGQGKSTVAQTLAERYSKKGIFGAAFFFDRASPHRNNPSYLMATLAAQLASSIPGLAECIARVVEAEGPGIFSKDQEEQSEKIIVQPLLTLKARGFRAMDACEEASKAAGEYAGEDIRRAAEEAATKAAQSSEIGAEWKRWIIIDGLDGCVAPTRDRQDPTQEDPKGAQLRVLKLIYNLRSRGVPLSFLIFARPEKWTMDYCKRRSRIIEMVDIRSFASHRKDVETVLRVGLCRIAARERRRFLGSEDAGTADEDDMASSDEAEDWPGEDRIQRLIEMIRGDMLSACDVVKRIETSNDDPEDRLDDLLQNGLQSKSEQSKSKTSTSTAPNQGQFSGATINGPVQLGGTSTSTNTVNTFNQSFQPGCTPQFTYTFNFGAGRPPVHLVEESESCTDQRLLQTS